MSYTFHTLTAKSLSYGSTRSTSTIKYIVLHYTGNKTDTAKGNANYFSPSGGNTRKAGAHYFVDDTTVYQSIPDTRTAWAVGGSKYSDCKSTGGGTMYGTITNSNSISIEMCSKNGAITDATITNAVALTKQLMSKYSIPVSHVYRHFDVTGKQCPGWSGWTGKNAPKWTALKQKLTCAEVERNADDMTETEVRKIVAAVAAETAKRTVSAWAEKAWSAATQAGILDGTAPQANVTREQLAQVFVNAGLIGGSDTPSSWAEQAFTAATDAGVLDGTNPHGLVTCEQLAQVLVNVGLVGTGQKTDAEEPQTE